MQHMNAATLNVWFACFCLAVQSGCIALQLRLAKDLYQPKRGPHGWRTGEATGRAEEASLGAGPVHLGPIEAVTAAISLHDEEEEEDEVAAEDRR